MVKLRTLAVLSLASLMLSSSARAQDVLVPPPPPVPTIWSFLGIPQGVKKVQGALTNRRGNHPNTEPHPALKALNDPENFRSPVKAIKQAAEIKRAEDLKPQKIKAIKYLASIGCGCYDKDGKVTEALIASAEDCTEEVRLVTMQSVLEAASGKCCAQCGIVCCCNEKMMKKLAEIAYEKDEHGCWLEPSARVREAAAAALRSCCPGGMPLEVLQAEPQGVQPDVGGERPLDRPDVGGERSIEPIRNDSTSIDSEPSTFRDYPRPIEAQRFSQPLGSNRARSAHVSDVDEQIELLRELNAATQISQPMLEIAAAPQPMPQPTMPARTTTARGTATNQTVMVPVKTTAAPTVAPRQAVKSEPAPFRTVSAVLPSSRQPGFAEMRSLAAQQAAGVQSSSNPRGGIVMAYSPQHRIGYVHFEDRNTHVTVGTQVYLRPDPITGDKGFLGFWRVTATEPGCALIVPLNDDTNLADATATVGNHVSFGMPEISVAPAAYHRR